jgi:hypothetical protein
LSDGRWGIDLNGLNFNNKLEDASLSLLDSEGTAIYTLDAYNPDTATGLRMYSTNLLDPVGSQKLSTLFRSGDVSGDWNTIKDYEVVGVYGSTFIVEDIKKYVTGATSATEPDATLDLITTINVKNGQIDISSTDLIDESVYTYKLYKVRFIGSDGVSGICSVSDTFYVIQASETGGVIYKSNHDAGQLLTLNASGEMSLADMFVKYYNDGSGALIEEKITDIDDDVEQITTITEISTSIDSGKLKVDGLQDYKNANPTKTTVKVAYKLPIDDDKTIYAEFTFKLPADVVVSAEQSSVNEIDITSLSVPVYDTEGNLSYQKLKDTSVSPEINNLNLVTGIVENSTSYTSEINKAEGTITLDGTKVGEYFTANTSATSLKISYTLTITTNGKTSTLNFVILVNETEA